MNGGLAPSAERLVSWLIRRRRGVLHAAAFLLLVSGVFATKLYSNLRSDLEELLPATAPSVLATKSIGPKLNPVSNLYLVLEGREPQAVQRFADALAARLRALGPDLVQDVTYRTDEQEAFVQRFGAFYLSQEELRTVLSRIRTRVAWEKRQHNAVLHLVEEEDAPLPPPLDFSDLEAKYGLQSQAQFRDGYYQTPDGQLLALLVAPSEKVHGYAQSKRFVERVRAEVKSLEPAQFDASLQVGLTGEVETPLEEQESLISDLAASTAVVVVFVLAALYLFFRRWMPVLALIASLSVGTSATFAVAWFLIGYLNANTAFLGSIVLGNGINVAIIFVARYCEERSRCLTTESALRVAWFGSLAATFIASFAAALAYLSLATTDFRGFSQFGAIGFLGMAFNWLSAFLLLPPLIATLEEWQPGSFLPKRPGHRWGLRLANLVQRHSASLRTLSAVLLGASLLAVLAYRGPVLETEVARVRSQKSLQSGATFWSGKLDEVFRTYLSPMVLRAETPADLDATLQALARKRAALGGADPLREVRTLRNALPDDADSKVALVAELRDALSDARLELLPPPARSQARRLRPPEGARPPAFADLPRSVRRALSERDGATGRIALAFPRKVGVLNADELEAISQLLRGSIADSGASTQAIAQPLLVADINAAILRDGPRATLLALVAVCALVALVFRRLGPTLLTCGSLLVGVTWLVGMAAAARLRVNFLNFVVLPITFGIGVDYAVNIVQRYRLAGPGAMHRVLQDTGAAVALCSATTVIGYASLLFADNQALRGFGLLASLGELSCLGAALLALPAWVGWREAAAGHRAPGAQSSLP